MTTATLTDPLIAGKYRINGPVQSRAFGPSAPADDLRGFGSTEILLLPARPQKHLSAHRLFGRLRALNDPQLIAPHDLAELPDGRLALVIAPPPGQPLDAWAARMPAQALVEKLIQAVQLLVRLHTLGWVHGALCPQHIRVLPGEQIAFWGVALVSLHTCLTGQPPSPHPAGDFADPTPELEDPRSDVYGLAESFLSIGLLPSHIGDILSRAAAPDAGARHHDGPDLALALGLPPVDDAELYSDALRTQPMKAPFAEAPLPSDSAAALRTLRFNALQVSPLEQSRAIATITSDPPEAAPTPHGHTEILPQTAAPSHPGEPPRWRHWLPWLTLAALPLSILLWLLLR